MQGLLLEKLYFFDRFVFYTHRFMLPVMHSVIMSISTHWGTHSDSRLVVPKQSSPSNSQSSFSPYPGWGLLLLLLLFGVFSPQVCKLTGDEPGSFSLSNWKLGLGPFCWLESDNLMQREKKKKIIMAHHRWAQPCRGTFVLLSECQL